VLVRLVGSRDVGNVRWMTTGLNGYLKSARGRESYRANGKRPSGLDARDLTFTRVNANAVFGITTSSDGGLLPWCLSSETCTRLARG
jgi:hypothetical protein